MSIIGKNYIGYTTSAEGTKTFQSYVPAIDSTLEETFTVATSDEVTLALRLAKEASFPYARTSATDRASFLEAICEEIMAIGDALLERAHLETALPMARLQGERARTINQLSQFAALLREGSWVSASIDTADVNRVPAPKPDLRKMFVPLGPVVVFGSSNFPFAYSVAGVDTGPALAAGCPVIVKAHPAHPGVSDLTAQAIVKAAQKTGMPEGTFSMLYDNGYEVGTALVQHPYTKAVGFTGSYKGGMALFKLAMERDEPIPVFAEMGSVNPVVLLNSAITHNGTSLAQTLAGSVTLGTGQFCTNPGLVFAIASDSLSKFEAEYQSALQAIAPTTMLTKGISDNFERLKQQALQQPETTLLAESTVPATSKNVGTPTVLKTTAKAFIQNPILQEEVFGPFSILVVADHMQELTEAITACSGQLTVSLFGEEQEIREQPLLVQTLASKAGRFIINGVPTGVEVCPSMHHGGPFPAATDDRFTSVGRHSIVRFVRPQSYQDWPDALLPKELQNANPLQIPRLVNNVWTVDSI